MKLNTMAAVMSFISDLETRTASFYDAAGEKHPGLADTCRARAKENRSFEKQVRQTYYGIITDTLESNYCFEGLDSDDYGLNLDPPSSVETVEGRFSEVEKTCQAFYVKAAELSDGLMADLPRLFKRIAKKRASRL